MNAWALIVCAWSSNPSITVNAEYAPRPLTAPESTIWDKTSSTAVLTAVGTERTSFSANPFLACE